MFSWKWLTQEGSRKIKDKQATDMISLSSCTKDKNNIVTSLTDTPVPLKLVCVARPLLKCSEPEFLCKHDWWNTESRVLDTLMYWWGWAIMGTFPILGWFYPFANGLFCVRVHMGMPTLVQMGNGRQVLVSSIGSGSNTHQHGDIFCELCRWLSPTEFHWMKMFFSQQDLHLAIEIKFHCAWWHFLLYRCFSFQH